MPVRTEHDRGGALVAGQQGPAALGQLLVDLHVLTARHPDDAAGLEPVERDVAALRPELDADAPGEHAGDERTGEREHPQGDEHALDRQSELGRDGVGARSGPQHDVEGDAGHADRGARRIVAGSCDTDVIAAVAGDPALDHRVHRDRQQEEARDGGRDEHGQRPGAAEGDDLPPRRDEAERAVHERQVPERPGAGGGVARVRRSVQPHGVDGHGRADECEHTEHHEEDPAGPPGRAPGRQPDPGRHETDDDQSGQHQWQHEDVQRVEERDRVSGNGPPKISVESQVPTNGTDCSTPLRITRLVPDSRSSGSTTPENPAVIVTTSTRKSTIQLSPRGRRNAPVKKIRAMSSSRAATISDDPQLWICRTRSPPRTSNDRSIVDCSASDISTPLSGRNDPSYTTVSVDGT